MTPLFAINLPALLAVAAHCADEQEKGSRYTMSEAFTGILFEPEARGAFMVATDGHSLAAYRYSDDPDGLGHMRHLNETWTRETQGAPTAIILRAEWKLLKSAGKPIQPATFAPDPGNPQVWHVELVGEKQTITLLATVLDAEGKFVSNTWRQLIPLQQAPKRKPNPKKTSALPYVVRPVDRISLNMVGLLKRFAMPAFVSDGAGRATMHFCGSGPVVIGTGNTVYRDRLFGLLMPLRDVDVDWPIQLMPRKQAKAAAPTVELVGVNSTAGPLPTGTATVDVDIQLEG